MCKRKEEAREANEDSGKRFEVPGKIRYRELKSPRERALVSK